MSARASGTLLTSGREISLRWRLTFLNEPTGALKSRYSVLARARRRTGKPPHSTSRSGIRISPMPKFLPNLLEGDMRKARGFVRSDAAFICVLGEPFSCKFLDDTRGFPAMKI